VVALEPQRLLDGVGVEGVYGRLARAVEPFRPGVDAARMLRDGLYADGDLHPAPASIQGLAPRVPAPPPVRVPRFGREPELMRRHRTTARGVFLLLLALGVLAGTAGARSKAPNPIIFPVLGAAHYADDFGQPRAGGPHQGIDILAAKKSLALAA